MPNGLPPDHPYLVALRVNQMRQLLNQPLLPMPPEPAGFITDTPPPAPRPPAPPRRRPTPANPDAVDDATARMLAAHNRFDGHRLSVDEREREYQRQVMTKPAAVVPGAASYADQALADLQRRSREAQAALEEHRRLYPDLPPTPPAAA